MSIPRQVRTLLRATLPQLRYCSCFPCVGQFSPLTLLARFSIRFRFSLLCLFFIYAAKVLLFFDMCKFLVQKNVFFVSKVKIRVFRVALVNGIFSLHNLATQDVYLRCEFVVSCTACVFAFSLQLRYPLLYFRYSVELLFRISLTLFFVNTHVLPTTPCVRLVTLANSLEIRQVCDGFYFAPLLPR